MSQRASSSAQRRTFTVGLRLQRPGGAVEPEGGLCKAFARRTGGLHGRASLVPLACRPAGI